MEVTSGSSEVAIGLIDGPVATNHAELASRTVMPDRPVRRATDGLRTDPRSRAERGGSAALYTVVVVWSAAGRPPRERANPRANVDRLQATPSYARRLSSLVKCPL